MSLFYKIRIAQEIAKCLKLNSETSVLKVVREINFQHDLSGDELIFSFSPFSNDNSKPWFDLSKISAINNDIVKNIRIEDEKADIVVDKNKFIEYTLTGTINKDLILSYRKPLTSVIDFSSPNIAKPFHFGHLRSTIIGNFIANASEYLDHKVIKLNYLGDWGIQFGLLKYGLDKFNVTAEQLETNPLKVLYNVYVKTNTAAEEDKDVHVKAQEIFRALELADGENEDLKKWHLIRKLTVTELSHTYKRLGINFDEYDWESDYSAKQIKPLIEELLAKNILEKENDAVVVRVNNDTSVPVMKKDGTSLYLSRDLAAVLDRYERFKFDRMLYVVDYSQTKHFTNLIALVNKVNPECASKMQHVMFGRVLGLSTRKGTAIFLEDILNEIQDRMTRKQIETRTTKAEVGGRTADILGISAVVVNDLKTRRVANYNFSWENALHIEGNTGIKLQYCHCRLHSLEEVNNHLKIPHECDVNALKEPEALKLIGVISNFDDAVLNSYDQLDASILTSYLFTLCNGINSAHKKLLVKGTEAHVASQRLLMFNKAKQLLNTGMKILGIVPLEKM